VTVQATVYPVAYEVQLVDFTKRLERKGGSPRETSEGSRVKELLSTKRSAST
jgi:hypothetical protein